MDYEGPWAKPATKGERPLLPLDDEPADVGPCLCGRMVGRIAGMDGLDGPTDEVRVRVEEG